ncbi:MAG: aminoglycoside phosphotransferase family protein [Planctomycetes bacterium]|nr:aminoglycoside phosphotransferase family protein [Planctomycetota bacterium]MCB9869538.1 aminoglycoside phosphotransferase family protein [Planctomycetota bacterium]MCB9889925.1 aminoglycoside phosphotransferase family protein [Planctomycetota bacterium]
MRPLSETEVRDAIAQFVPLDTLYDVQPLHRGHIHDTFVSRWPASDLHRQLLHQRINETVFPDLDRLMGNIATVSQHLVAKVDDGEAEDLEPLRLVPARDGAPFARTDAGAWRCYVFIDNTTSFDRCSGPEQAFEAACAFGGFQALLHDLPAEALAITLPNFFSTPHRFAQLERALSTASAARRSRAAAEIEFAMARQGITGVIDAELRAGRIPTRVVHGDTKLNNILFDRDSGRARAIVDLDTCMPGWSLYDFGDLVRYTAARSAEDETDLALIGTDLELYRALEAGYLSAAGSFLTPTEVRLMPFAARLVTYTIGIRFLADFLGGDHYFKVDHPEHNLDRARVQLRMVAAMEDQLPASTPT